MKLFDPKIPILDELSEHSEFEKVQEEFSQYDSTYVFNASVRSRRQPILEAYRKCSEYLDDDFCKEICKPGKFIDRLWELQICFVLISSGHEVIKRTSGRKFARPDFCIKNNELTVC